MNSDSPLSICTMKWEPPVRNDKTQLHKWCGEEMVNSLYHELKRHVRVPFRFICITDYPYDLDSEIETAPLPGKLQGMYHSWPKVFLHSEEMRSLAGDRFAYFDMDAVILDDITEVLTRKDEMLTARFNESDLKALLGMNKKGRKNSLRMCNSCFYLMNTACCHWVWDEFNLGLGNVNKSIEKPKHLLPYKGTDQAWVSYMLHHNFMTGDITTLGSDEGFYEYKRIGNDLPEDAKVIFFGGKDHPYSTETREKAQWLKEARPA